jgi:hypothetical protein
MASAKVAAPRKKLAIAPQLPRERHYTVRLTDRAGDLSILETLDRANDVRTNRLGNWRENHTQEAGLPHNGQYQAFARLLAIATNIALCKNRSPCPHWAETPVTVVFPAGSLSPIVEALPLHGSATHRPGASALRAKIPRRQSQGAEPCRSSSSDSSCIRCV